MRLSIKHLLYSTIQNNIAKLNGNSGPAAFRIYFGVIKAVALALTLVASTQIAAADSRLIMVTSDHCPYCQAWELDVGAVYDKSPYAAKLPLTRVEIGIKMPENVAIKKPVVGTPTFLIIRDGHEIDRQRGYIDAEMFFWWLSEQMS